MVSSNSRFSSAKLMLRLWALLFCALFPVAVSATPFTMTVPDTGVAVPTAYPEAGGIVTVLTGVNGNVYYQFSDPSGAFVGYQNNGSPRAFRGNPFTINSPIQLDCGFRDCVDYFGGAIARMDVRFTAYDGDTQNGGFDFNDISLLINGVNIGNWSGRLTEKTNEAGTQSRGFETGFGNNALNTGWFSSTNAALMSSVLQNNQLTTQVYDDDPNDNYWDFTYGDSLQDAGLRTIAPGVEFDKTRTGGSSTFTAAGQVIQYDYVVRNIGSVALSNVAVTDDKIANVTCSPTNLPKTNKGADPATLATANCTGFYTVTQADVDRGTLTNIASSTATPAYGTLGRLTDTVTLTGPTQNSAISLAKSASPTSFAAANQTITYTFTAANTGNTTLTNVVVTDPKIPGLSCSLGTLLPLTVNNTQNSASCTGTYVTKQSDVDAFAINSQPLANTATARGTDPRNTQITNTATANINGPAALPTLTIDKSAPQTTFSAVGDVIAYRFDVRNTGNVTWPGPPAVTDSFTAPPSCPSGPVAPGGAVRCTVNYSVTQPDLDRGRIDNTATATITVGGVTRAANDSHAITATLTPSQSIVKRLQAGAVTPVRAVNDPLVYEYVVRNTGNVTITDPTVTDDKVAVNCPTGNVAPGASITCTSATYLVTQADLDAGAVVNTATAGGTLPQGGTVPPVATSQSVPASRQPALGMDKVAETIAPGDFLPGRSVRYTYNVTNSGNVTITSAISVTDDKTPVNCPALPAGGLLPGGLLVCTADYIVTTTDVQNGLVTNSAFATDGQTTSNTDSATIPQVGNPALSLAKVALTTDFADIGDTIDYRFTVTNSGDTPIFDFQPISINDARIDPATLVCNQPPQLNTDGDFDCTATSIPLTQADIDNGSFANTASASFEFQRGGNTTIVTSPTATAVVTSANEPEFTIAKSGPANFSAVGQVVTYTFTVTNLNAQTLTRVVVTDPLIPGLVCPITDLREGNPQSCTGTYTVTQADMDRGTIDNTVTGVGTSPSGQQATATDSLSIPVDPAAATRVLTFAKTASVATFSAPGDVIDYRLRVTNTGTLTLTNVLVTDTALGLSCTLPSLAPNATNNACRGSHIVTQADVDAGSYVNAAQASADNVAPLFDAVTVQGPTRVSSIALTKAATNDFAVDGDQVTFTFRVENTGNVTQTGVSVTDAFFDPDLVCPVPDLLPGVVDTSCTATFTVSPADVDRGSITNTARVDSTGGNGVPAFDESTAIANGPAASPAVRIEKTSAGPDLLFGAPLTTEVFDFEVFNTGNVTLTSVEVSDPLTGFACTTGPILPGQSVTTCADTSALRTSYVVQQSDVDNGSLSNTVLATGQSQRGGPVNDSDTISLTGPDQLPALSVVKLVANGDNYSAVGDTISYTFDVQNTGTITLTQPVTINDPAVTANCPALPNGGLVPLAILQCTGTARVTQADLDRGFVDNTASATMTQPVIPSATYPTGEAAVTSPEDTVRATANQSPALTLVKRIKAGTPSTFDALNAPVVYEFVVTNSGNVTTTSDITIDDLDIPANFTCAPAGLAPDATAICEATWLATQGALDDGSFTNRATASTVFGGVSQTSPQATATANAVQNPRLILTKTITDVTPPNQFQAGTRLTYSYTVTNPLTGPGTPGNVTIDGPFSVADNRTTVNCNQPASGELAPGESTTCLAVYDIVSNDLDLGSVQNVATATGRFDNQPVTSPKVAAIYPVEAEPAVNVRKAADPVGATFSQVGDELYYSFTVTNPVRAPGQNGVALREDIYIQDDKLGNFLCRPKDPDNDLNIGDSYTCNTRDLMLPYSVTQADIDRGFVTNEASAQTVFAPLSDRPIPVESSAAEVTVTGQEAPELSLTKVVTNGPATAVVGDTLNYTIQAANTGNQTLRGVAVSDPLIPALTCTPSGGNVTLLPTEVLECTGSYVVAQADVDNGNLLTNTATGRATDPQGADVTGTAVHNQPLDPALPAVRIVKQQIDDSGNVVDPPIYRAVDEFLTFRMTVTNTGNITLDNVAVTDSLVGGTCNLSTPLAPGAADQSCTFEYQVTQTDIDNNTISNTGTVTADPRSPGATQLRETDILESDGPLREPKVSLTKSVDVITFATDNVTLTYGYVIANEGNITLTQAPVLTDDKIDGADLDCDAFPAAGLLPGDAIECRASYVTTQADVNAGFVTNIADVTLPNPLDPATPLTSQDTQTAIADRTSAITLTKLADDDTLVVAGQDITYRYLVTNAGNTTLTDIVVADLHTSASGTGPLTLSNDGEIAQLLPGAEVTLTAVYRVTQADVDANQPLTNTATVTSTSPDGVNPTVNAEESVTVAAPAPELFATKSVASAPLGAAAVGDEIVYAITVRNTGNVSLKTVTFDDTLTRTGGAVVTPAPVPVKTGGDTVNPDVLDVGETWTYSATHALTQADIDAGGLSNVLTVAAIDPNDTPVEDLAGTGAGDNELPAVVTLTQTTGLNAVKALVPPAGPVAAGTVVTFDVQLANTGNATLRDVGSTDLLRRADNTVVSPAPVAVKTGGDVGEADVLEVGEIWTYRVVYTLTQTDIDAGGISNSLTFTATDPNNQSVIDVSDDGDDTDGNTLDDPAELSIPLMPDIEVTKIVAQSGNAVGDVVIFDIFAANTGNVTLTNVAITDTLTDLNNDPRLTDPVVFADGAAATVLGVGATNRYTLTYTLTQDDVDAGGLRNAALAEATGPKNTVVRDLSDNGSDGDGNTENDPTELILPVAPAMSAVKAIVDGPVTVGGLVVFDIRVTNDGNVTLRDVAIASDTLTRAGGTPLTLTSGPVLRSSSQGSPAGTLAVGETAVWRATYRLTQADVDAGGISNIAVATGTPPSGPALTAQTRDTDNADGNPAVDPTVLTIPSNPALSIDKVLTAGGPTFSAVDDVLEYRFDVTNTGNVTLTDGISIVDARITDAGGAIDCPTGPLAPQAAISCTATYAVTQEDIDAGGVTNTARAVSGAATSGPDSVTVPAQRSPAMDMVKTAVSITTDGTTYTDILATYFKIGAEVRYDYVVANTGNTTITDAITVTDNLIGVSCPALPDGLAPGAATTCTGSYTVNGNDVILTSVTNTARATDGTTSSPTASETVPLDGTPALTVDKSLIAVNGTAGTDFDAVDDVLTYQFVVTNAGDAAFARDVVVTDTLLDDPVVCFDAQSGTRNLADGDTAVCTATYTVTQDDLDRGAVVNEAVATTIFGPDGDTTIVSSVPAQVTSSAAVTSELTLVKSAQTLPITTVGQELTYTLTITNTGNQRLRNVTGTDPLLPRLTCEAPLLAPGAELVCADTYIVRQADVDAGTLVNTANVSAINPQGQARTATDTLTLAMPTAVNDLTLSKIPSVSPFGAAGSTVTFDLVVRNGGNLTLYDLIVTDAAIDPDYRCTVPVLAPGASDSRCSVVRVVTQDDVDAGSLSNTAAATGRDAQNNAVEADVTVAVPGRPRIGALDVTKIVTQSGSNVDDVVIFEITALNAGNVSIRNVGIVDKFTRADGIEITGAAPILVNPSVAADPLLPGEERVWTLTHRLTQADLDAQGLANTATVAGIDPTNATVDDTSDNGNDDDGNTDDDPTRLNIVSGPAIELVKRLTTSGAVVGDPVVFTLVATNTGNVTLSDPVLTDTFTRADGTAITGEGPVADDPAVESDPLLPDATRVWTLTHVLTQDDIDAGGLSNTATITSIAPNDDPIIDVSDNGIDDDGNVTDDPTLLPIAQTPDMEVTKTLTQTGSEVGDVVVFQIAVENTGNVTLLDLVVTDTMTDMAGNPRDPGPVTFVSGDDPAVLAVGATNLFAISYALTQDDLNAGGLINIARGDAATSSGGVLSDNSDNGDDSDGNTTNDPTILQLDGISAIEVTKSAGIPVRNAADRIAIEFEIAVENTGNVVQTGVQVVDDLRAFAAPAKVVSVTRPQITGFSGPGGVATGFDGVRNPNTLRGDVQLAVEQTGTVSFTVVFDPTAGYPAQDNVALVTTDRIVEAVSGNVGILPLPPADVRVVKVADTETALLGGSVGYTLTFENMNESVETGLTLIDALPAGLSFTPGSASYDGADTPQPTVRGSLLEWQNITLGPLQKVTITLDTRVTGGDGNLTNSAYVLDPGQNIISNRAEATISRRPEAVFDCGDVIGKVFDDRNMNGYQDGPTPESRAQITDQTYIGGKGDPVAIERPQGEPGLPGVRLATVNGTVITTDAYGRFSVPCAELPADIGSNFTLKLDTRTLPTGYRITTENPRVVRLTPGTVAKMNFGAAISNVVDIDLTAAAFVGGSAKPIAALPEGIDTLIGQIRDVPSVLRLSYYAQGEARALARARLDAVEDLIQSRWRDTGRYRLLVERSVQALQ